MRKKPVTRVMCLLLAVVFCLGVLVLPTAAASSDKLSAAESQIESMKKYLDSESYDTYRYKYETQAGKGAGDKEYIATFLPASDSDAHYMTLDEWTSVSVDKVRPALNENDYREGVVYSPSSGKTSYTVNVETEGMYYIVVEYYNTDETVNAIERKLYIDNKMPFSEAAAFSMTETWKYEYEEDGGFRQDIIGNDLTPSVNEYCVWKTYICSDVNGYEEEYYRFYLSAGTHTITFDAIREGAVFGEVKVVPAGNPNYPTYNIPTYETYKALVQQALTEAGRAADVGVISPAVTPIMLPAEKPSLVSDSSVSMTNNKNSSITEPTDPSCDKYNVIGANSYKSVGQWAAYDITPTASGFYSINMRYLQNVLDGMFISRTVKITSYGKGDYVYGIGATPTVPFQEAGKIRFNYDKDWHIGPMSDGSQDFTFFFEKGVKYTIYFEVSLGALSEQLQAVENSLEKLNECYLQILRVTGPDPDENTDYRFESVIPDTLIELCEQAVILNSVRDEFARICGVEQAAHLATMDNIVRQVAKMGSDEEEIAKGLSELKSSLGTLGTWISNSKESTLIVDYITVASPDAEKGKENANFFDTIIYEIKAFFISFNAEYDKMGITDPEFEDKDPLEVWQASGRDQNKIVRNMIDAFFADYCTNDDNYTSKEEIPVSLKLVTGGTLLPSILAGKGPDVYMGLDAGSIMNYAIRGAILPVSDMEDYNEVVGEFSDAAIDSIKLPILDIEKLKDPTVDPEDKWKVYGLPMTMSFAMMFYRADFLVRQGIAVPETWDELLALLPTLRDNNMDIGMNYTLALDFFLYQKGGDMWKYTDDPAYAGAEIGLDTDIGREAFDYCAKLYTDYSFPVHYDAANRFRTGEMPIIIQDYVSTYNQLIVFATEIEGLWAFSHIPGFVETDEYGKDVLDENGDRKINYTSMAGISAAVITKDGEDRMEEAWQYMKWCTGADYISEYSNRIVSLLGPSAKYASPSEKALANMSWTSAERDAILEQMEHLDTIINYPGSYYIGRHTSFAFLAAVNNGEDPVTALNSYINTINSEITRKRQEFGLPTADDLKLENAGS